jgi:hypothetical protein
MVAKTLILCRILHMGRLGRLCTILMASFRHAIQSPSEHMSERRVYISCPCHSRSEASNEENQYFLCPLMKDLKKLWQGVDAYDSHLKC